ncbi:MAG: amidohydrolase family protein [Oscillospiraceae bacterium]|nr:amidohydrolase family protein [Oscillospiraceae bacterium]
MNILIKNGTVINADGRCIADVVVKDGVITEVCQGARQGDGSSVLFQRENKTDEPSPCLEFDEVVDASGLLVLPGSIDVHTHFELSFGDTSPTGDGFSSADDFFTGTRAAACGGVTTIMDFVTPEKNENLVEALEKRKSVADAKTCIDYGLHMGISELNDRVLEEMADVKAAGVSSFKVFMTYAFKLTDDEFKRTLTRVKEIDALVMVHAEDHEALEANRAEFIATGKTDAWHHYLSRPEEVEAKAVKKAIKLAKETGGTLYIVHLACAEGLEAVIEAQQEGYPIYAETCPQYLNFTCDVYKRPDGRNFICSPPMKGKESQYALWASVCQGARQGDGSSGFFSRWSKPDEPSPCLAPDNAPTFGINTLATDHCPFQTYEKDRGKDDFTKTPNGVMGVENLYPYMLSQANKGILSFERVVELCTANPAKIFGIAEKKGEIAPGKDADIVLYDPTKEFTISQKNMHSTIDYTIWEGTKLKGYPVRTYSRGNLIYKNGEFLGESGWGRFIYD